MGCYYGNNRLWWEETITSWCHVSLSSLLRVLPTFPLATMPAPNKNANEFNSPGFVGEARDDKGKRLKSTSQASVQ